jgi:hypothetical protein
MRFHVSQGWTIGYLFVNHEKSLRMTSAHMNANERERKWKWLFAGLYT